MGEEVFFFPPLTGGVKGRVEMKEEL